MNGTIVDASDRSATANIAVTKRASWSANQFLVNNGTNTWAGLNLSGNFTGDAVGTALDLSNTGVGAGTYGSASNVPQITVDAKGRITNASNVAIAISPNQITGGANGEVIVSNGTNGNWQALSTNVTLLGNGTTTPFGINLANSNTWTATQTFSAVGNGIIVTTNADFRGSVANSTGNLNLNDNVDVANDLTVNGNATFNGDATLGNANTDNVVFNADVNSNIVPNTDNAYDLGSSTKIGEMVTLHGNL